MCALRVALATFLVSLLTSCAHQEVRFDPAARPTCLVLSVGGAAGIAHIGAIQAVQEAGIPIRCVVGTSMGAVVGSLYASAPKDDPDRAFRHLVDNYLTKTKEEKVRAGFWGAAILGGVAAILSGGVLVPLVAAGAGAKLGADAAPTVEIDRFTRSLDDVLRGVWIEQLPIPFATLFQEATETGVEIRTARSGNLAQAVAESAANPLIFPQVTLAPGQALDPGADRVSAIPVQDACRLFPNANLLAINVTGQPIFKDTATTCPTLEVRIEPGTAKMPDVFSLGPEYRRVVAAGREATRAALAHQ
ncbi:MAG TPA: patatin-like phospholipase family protein [Fimbriimonas sp.]|nr:patatin-like phospholipase family protein [Fimbriimonas sp.]